MGSPIYGVFSEAFRTEIMYSATEAGVEDIGSCTAISKFLDCSKDNRIAGDGVCDEC
jgi:hypothetical protein